MMKRNSLIARLTWPLGIGLSVLWLISVAASTVVVRHELEEMFDASLRNSARQLLVHASQGALQPGVSVIPEMEEVPPEEGEEDDDDEEDEEAPPVFQIRDAAGAVVSRSPDAPQSPFGAPLRTGFFSAGDYRVFSQRPVNGAITVQVADRLDYRAESLLEILIWQILPLAGIPPFAGLIIFIAVRRALRPISGVRDSIGARGGADLRPIPAEGLPLELTPIVDDVNRLLERLDKALQAERSFAANSAHELRTPLAGAIAQIGLLARELEADAGSARVERVADSLKGLGNLVEKLLQLSRADASVALTREPVDLGSVISILVEDFTRDPAHGDRIVSNIATERELVVETDIDAIAIALRNLIENALVHGDPNRPVVVEVRADRAIRVRNDGAVVPPETLALLTTRFERAGARTPGSGLGLAIADAIVKQAGGKLELLSPATGSETGFEAIISFD